MNLASAWLLNEGHEHEHDHDHDNDRDAHRHHDHNLRAAYLHVLADAVASLLAIAALLSGRFFGWTWMDPVMGIVGALAIAHWSLRLMRSSGAVLLDTVIDRGLQRASGQSWKSAATEFLIFICGVLGGPCCGHRVDRQRQSAVPGQLQGSRQGCRGLVSHHHRGPRLSDSRVLKSNRVSDLNSSSPMNWSWLAPIGRAAS